MTTIMKSTLNRFLPGIVSGKKSVIDRLVALQAIRTERRKLAEMDSDGLRDIGISRRQANMESRRPAWDAPARWLH